jgi:hypothetical protein
MEFVVVMGQRISEEFREGETDYWAGRVPEHWDSEELRARSPYLMGWYMASEFDNYPYLLRTAQEVEEYSLDALLSEAEDLDTYDEDEDDDE